MKKRKKKKSFQLKIKRKRQRRNIKGILKIIKKGIKNVKEI
jgi:hypothetical protein|tara:strand:- start:199 stop:321 length:123 start_codon:yes stop_codon:yes gene_type:complete